jgi:peptidoglycan/xylan/chitin deacetylase (PgdA/CDA1 family)
MFHKVNDLNSTYYPGVPTKTFEQLMQFVKQNFTVIHFKEIPDFAENKPKKPLLIITFDDGMDDIRTNVFDYMELNQLKYTINIDTKILIDGKPQYFIQIYDILNRNSKPVSYLDDRYMEYAIQISGEKPAKVESAFTNVLSRLKNDEKEDFIVRMHQNFNLTHPVCSNVLTNEWIAAQKDNPLIEFGSHSHSHPVFSGLSNDEIIAEITESKQILEEILHKKVTIFAYPNGIGNSKNDQLLRQFGYEYILYTQDKLNIKANNKFYFRMNMYHASLERAILQMLGILSKIRTLKHKVWN